MYYRKLIVGALLLTFFLGLSGCATVPKEAVSLSYAIGEDLAELHTGYRNTVQFSFEMIRKRGLYAIDNTWTPVFLKEFIDSGGLIDAAKNDQFDRVEFWARLAIEQIEEQRRSFLDPLQIKEDALLSQIDEAFGRVIRANATVTALVSSVKNVQDLQDKVLDEFGVKALRDTINNGIIDASNFAEEKTKAIQDLTKKIEDRTQAKEEEENEEEETKTPASNQ